MALSLTAQFLAYLEKQFGIVISNPNELMFGSGSSVNDASVKAAAKSTAAAPTPTDTGSGGAGAGGGASAVLQEAMAVPSLLSSVPVVKGMLNGNKTADLAKAAQKLADQKTADASALSDARHDVSVAQGNAQDLSRQMGSDSAALKQDYDNQIKSTTYYRDTMSKPDASDWAKNYAKDNLADANQRVAHDTEVFQSDQAKLTMVDPNNDLVKLSVPENPYANLLPTNDSTGGISVFLDTPNDLGPGDFYPDPATVSLPDRGPILETESAPMADITIDAPGIDTIEGANAEYVKALSKSFNDNLPTTNVPAGKSFLSTLWASPYVKTGMAGLSGFGLYESIKSLATNVSFSGIMGALTTAWSFYTSIAGFGKIKGLSSLNFFQNTKFFHFMTTPAGAMIMIAAIVILALLLSQITKNTTPAAPELPVVDMPTVWTSGAVYFIGVGAALAVAGISIGPSASLTQTITVPTVTLTAALNSSSLTDTSGNAVGAGAYSLAGSVFVGQGTGAGGADQVMYVTPSGNGQSTVHVDTLKPGLKFASPAKPSDAYLNFFNGSSPNQDAVAGLQQTIGLTQAAQQLSGTSGVTAMQIAGAASKKVTTGH